MKKAQGLQDLETRILNGLSCEWDIAIQTVAAGFRTRMQRPLFALRDFKGILGYWSLEKREISLSRQFVLNHCWDDIREVLLHEMAHQFTTEVSGVLQEPPHGRSFQNACRLLKANPTATGSYVPLRQQILDISKKGVNNIRVRIQKLLALAQSNNLHEAEAAMIKAHELMSKYETTQILQNVHRNYLTVFAGKPALRHFREDYALALLLMDFYFVKGIWVSAYVIEKAKMGKVLEISGTAQNLQIASYVYDFIRQFIEFEWKRYNVGDKLNRYRKTDFSVGILSGFRMKLHQESPIERGAPHTHSLIPVQDLRLKQYFAVRYPRVARIQRKGGRCQPEVMSDGAEIGKTLVIRKGISQPVFDTTILYLK